MSSLAGSPITTHVLDLASGRPASGIVVFLLRKEEGEGGWREMGRGVTNADGRAMSLLPSGGTLSVGTYQLRFDTRSYFKENLSSLSPSFFPEITITFSVTDPAHPHHIPLLLSPFGYSTYRGS